MENISKGKTHGVHYDYINFLLFSINENYLLGGFLVKLSFP